MRLRPDKYVILIIAALYATQIIPPARADTIGRCEPGHAVESVRDDGRLVALEDGSIWLVADASVEDALQWVATENVMICEGKLTNTDNHTTIEAEKLE